MFEFARILFFSTQEIIFSGPGSIFSTRILVAGNTFEWIVKKHQHFGTQKLFERKTW